MMTKIKETKVPKNKSSTSETKQHTQTHHSTTNPSVSPPPPSRPPNPLTNASFISKLCFHWPLALLQQGLERPLEESDLPDILEEDASNVNLIWLEGLWDKELHRVEMIRNERRKQRRLRVGKEENGDGDVDDGWLNCGDEGVRPSLQWAICKDFFWTTWMIQPLMLSSVIAKTIMPIALGYIIQSFENQSTDGYYWAAVLIGCNVVVLFEHHHLFYLTWHKGMQIRIGVVAAVFSKSLRLRSIGSNNDNTTTAQQKNNTTIKKSINILRSIRSPPKKQTKTSTTATSGQIMNLVSNDAERFLLAPLFISYLFWAPLQAIATLFVGVAVVGPAFAIGVGLLLVFFVPLQIFLMKRFAVLRLRVAKITDARVTLISQIISGCRVMKMSAWEHQFDDRIAKIRRLEINQISKANRLKALNEAIYFSVNVVVPIVIFLVHVNSGGVLNPRVVFTTMSFINILQLEVTKHFSIGVMSGSECWVSISRIQKFLETPELTPVRTIVRSSSSIDDDGQKDAFLESPKRCTNKNSSSSINTTTTTGDRTMSLQDNNKNDEQLEGDQSAILSLSNITCDWYESTNIIPNNNTIPTIDNQNSIALSNINLTLQPNSLTCIIGTVGSGKTALLLALAGELPQSKGNITTRRGDALTIAYAAQDPWIMNGTVKENILMGGSSSTTGGGDGDVGDTFDKQRYGEIVTACGLSHDFTRLPNGEETIVGDRGVQCSGGQRARIGLARALYRDADLLLLDDPLSAVDSKVGRRIFFDGIIGLAVNRGKCVVLATHQHQFIGDSIRCVLMSGGEIQKIGSFTGCVDVSDGKLHRVSYNAANDSNHPQNQNNDHTPPPSDSSSSISSGDGNVVNDDNDENDQTTKEEASTTPEDGIPILLTGKSSNTIQDEQKTVGVVRKGTYLIYARAMGSIWVAVAVLVLFAVTQVASLLSIVFIGRWSELDEDEQTSTHLIVVVLALGGSVLFLSISRAQICFALTIRASKRLHDAMTRGVLRAKVEFFDTNPSGRILNRFSADVGSNDDLLPNTLFDLLACSFIMLGAILTAVVALPFILVVIPPLFWYFMRVRGIFITSSRELRRLDGLARSPVYAMLGESIVGIATLRVNRSVEYFRRKFEERHDAQTRAFYAFLASSRWLGFRMDLIMFVITASSSFLAVLFSERDWFTLDPVIFGLALSMLVQLGALFQWTVRISAEVVNQMVAVERASEYSMLPSEAPLEISDSDDTAKLCSTTNWPRTGTIQVTNLATRYRSALPLSLKNISFEVRSGQRVGIVGRTGSGKSTLVQALFRILESERGTIIIDGIDISTLGLHTLRKNLSVINQYPVLFSGCTVRENLDPFSEHNDSKIREALVDVQMSNAIDSLPDNIHHVVDEGGSNFSMGERQLLCLARAILRKSKILVLDEPTANVDSRTDKLLQEAVNKSFDGATILSVAHRLDTIIENDMILVLGDGEVLEYGTPNELLLGGDGGYFASMVDDTGEEMAGELRRRAREAASGGS